MNTETGLITRYEDSAALMAALKLDPALVEVSPLVAELSEMARQEAQMNEILAQEELMIGAL